MVTSRERHESELAAAVTGATRFVSARASIAVPGDRAPVVLPGRPCLATVSYTDVLTPFDVEEAHEIATTFADKIGAPA